MSEKLTFYYQNYFFEGVVTSDFDAYCITETWLHSDIDSVDYFPEAYNVFCSDRDYKAVGQRYGGGVLIAVSDAVPALRRFDLEVYSECVWIEIKIAGGRHLLVGNCYLPPSMSRAEFGVVLHDISSKLDPEKYEIIIFGDLNVPGTWWELLDTSKGPSKALHLVNFVSFKGFGLGDLPANACGNVLYFVSSYDGLKAMD